MTTGRINQVAPHIAARSNGGDKPVPRSWALADGDTGRAATIVTAVHFGSEVPSEHEQSLPPIRGTSVGAYVV